MSFWSRLKKVWNRLMGRGTSQPELTPAVGRPVIRGIQVPQLSAADSSTMVRRAGQFFKQTTTGWTAAEKAAFWQELARQIEARHSPAWVSMPLRGTNGEYVFSGRMIGVHGLVIDRGGNVFIIGKDVDVSIDLLNMTVTVTPRNLPPPTPGS